MGKNFVVRLFALLMVITHLSCAQAPDVRQQYLKKEFRIPMRDGKTLFTAVYMPRDSSRDYPILLTRTPYSVAPYGADKYKRTLGPSPLFQREGYIFVYQDVRGRFMSEGEFANMRPYIPHKTQNQIDETTDTYDTIEWLIRHIPHNNGRVGMWGISYPGFYTAMGLIDAHPALVAASPQAPIANWFIGDDMHHNGAFSLNLAFNFYSVFGLSRDSLTTRWPKRFDFGTPDGYEFFLNLGALPNANKRYFHGKIAFWNELMKHGAYDSFWQKRNILPHLHNIKPAVLVVGGWYDAEDLYGTLHIFRQIEREDSLNKNFLIMGPWFHGGWARSKGDRLGDIRFGSETSTYYQQQMEFPFFQHYLKGDGAFHPDNVTVFDGGANRWRRFDQWPPQSAVSRTFYLAKNHRLRVTPDAVQGADEYVSDPAKPVPFINKITTRWSREYMVSDQRFAARRPDVLVYRTEPLADSLTVAGEISANLFVSTTATDADWVVKLIDVYPDTFPDYQPNPCAVRMGGYQRLVRAEIMRGKFRDSYRQPQPFKPGRITRVNITLQDVYHTFKPGHRIMVQVQSSWFPLFDRNPQVFTDIYRAQDTDFQKATQRVYFGGQYPSSISFLVENH